MINVLGGEHLRQWEFIFCWLFAGATPVVITPAGGVCGGGSWLACVLGNTNVGGDVGMEHLRQMGTLAPVRQICRTAL